MRNLKYSWVPRTAALETFLSTGQQHTVARWARQTGSVSGIPSWESSAGHGVSQGCMSG